MLHQKLDKMLQQVGAVYLEFAYCCMPSKYCQCAEEKSQGPTNTNTG